MAFAEPDRLRTAFFLRGDAQSDYDPERIAYAREPQKLPVVLSADEVVRFLEAIPEPKEPHGADHGLRGRPARVAKW